MSSGIVDELDEYNSKCRSWTSITDPLVLLPVTRQERDDCWAQALIRMFDAILKIAGILLPGEELCVDEFVSQISESIVDEDGSILNLEDIISHLRTFGAIVVNPGMSTQRYCADEFDIIYRHEFDTTKEFEDIMVKRFMSNPLACTIFFHDSYTRIEPGELYTPTPQERIDAKDGYRMNENGNMEKIPLHSVLLTGVHPDYFQFQDSQGATFGKNGFIYIARNVDAILDYAFITVEHQIYGRRGPGCGKLEIEE